MSRNDRKRYMTRRRENRIILGLSSNGTGVGERQSVLCVDQRYREKVERSNASGGEVLGSSGIRAEPKEVNV